MSAKRQKIDWVVLAPAAIAAVIAIGIVAAAAPDAVDSSRLVSVQRLPADMGMCEWDNSAGADPDQMASLQKDNLFSALRESSSMADPSAVSVQEPLPTQAASETQDSSATLMAALAQNDDEEGGGGRRNPNRYAIDGSPHLDMDQMDKDAINARAHGALAPLRTIRDTAPGYSAIGLYLNANEVILQDNNLQSFRVFDRLSPTPKSDNEISKPKRVVMGVHTWLDFNNGLYLDPATGDIFSVESDTSDRMVHFAHDASGDMSPKAMLHTPHRVYNLSADESKQELFATVEFPSQVVVYRKDASGEEKPLRALKGEHTGLDGLHGIAVDEKDQLLFVNMWGSHSISHIAGTGKYYPPSIKVYPLDANGDVKPLRVITGDKTLLDWPAAMNFNPDNGDLYIANDVGQSILVFANVANPDVQGDVAPARIIKGPSTGCDIRRVSPSTGRIKRYGFPT